MTAVERLVANGNNIIRFLKEFTVDSAKNVSITYINADGSESIKTFPNIAKQFNNLENWKNNFVNGNDAKKLRSMPKMVGEGSPKFGDFTNWTVSSFATVQHIGSIRSGTAWKDRNDFDKEWLRAMGMEGSQHFAPISIKIYKITIPKDHSGHCLPFFMFPISYNNYTTYAAFVKHVQGAVPYGWWCQGLQANAGVQLCGGHVTSELLHYGHCHPFKDVGLEDTIVYVANAGVVDTYVDLTNPKNWWNIDL